MSFRGATRRGICRHAYEKDRRLATIRPAQRDQTIVGARHPACPQLFEVALDSKIVHVKLRAAQVRGRASLEPCLPCSVE